MSTGAPADEPLDHTTANETAAALARDVADELRLAIAALSTRSASEADLRAARDLARQLHGHLEGPPRPRWYDAGEPGGLDERSKDSFHDLSPLRGQINALAPPLDLRLTERGDGTPIVAATATLGPAYEGPPHGVHGGFVAALFDEVLGATQALAAGPGVTGRLTVHYRHLTPLGEQLRFEGWVEQEEGRRLLSKATCHAEDGTLCADAEGLFLKVDFQALQQMMQDRKA